MKYEKMLFSKNPFYLAFITNSYPKHCHHEIEVYYCIEGELKIILDNTEYLLTNGSILLVSSLAMHQIVLTNPHSKIFMMEFGAKLIGEDFYQIACKTFKNPFITTQDNCPYIDHLLTPIKKLCYEYINSEKGYLCAIRGHLFDLFSKIIRYVPLEKQTLSKHKTIEKLLKIQDIFTLVEEEYASNISLERAANHVGYNPSAFCRFFKEITNTTFLEYLNSYRIGIAMRLLEQSTYSVTEIGYMVGFENPKNFRRIFKKYVNMIPSDYRISYLEGLSL